METKVLEKADSEEPLVPPDHRTGDGEGKWGSKSPPEGDLEGGRGVPESVEAIAVFARGGRRNARGVVCEASVRTN